MVFLAVQQRSFRCESDKIYAHGERTPAVTSSLERRISSRILALSTPLSLQQCLKFIIRLLVWSALLVNVQFGGFCAYGVAAEDWWDASNLGPPGNPDQWEIIDGSLYFFKSAIVREMFMGTDKVSVAKSILPKTTELLALGRARWDGWFGDAPAYNTAPSDICACPNLPGEVCTWLIFFSYCSPASGAEG
jgi:hypothetical protein